MRLSKKLLLCFFAACLFSSCTPSAPAEESSSETAVHEHEWSNWAIFTPSTCTKEGLQIRSCLTCRQPETAPVPVIEHTYETLPSVPKTCTEPGKTDGIVCAVCGYVKKRQDTIPASHSYGSPVLVIKPTCTSGGVSETTCSECGFKKSILIKAASHTLNAQNVCTVCGKIVPQYPTLNAAQKKIYDTLQYISNRSFRRDGDNYVYRFCLSNSNRDYVKLPVTVIITITNDSGESVYKAALNLYESDFVADDAVLKIPVGDITNGKNKNGTANIQVKVGDSYWFEAQDYDVSDLPLLPVTISLPETPLTVKRFLLRTMMTETKITSLTVEYTDYSTKINYTATKLFDYDGSDGNTYCSFRWKLRDSEGVVLDSGLAISPSISTGETFKDSFYIDPDLVPGETYTLEISDYT